MTWLTIGLLAAGAYAFKWFGLEILGRTPRSVLKSGADGDHYSEQNGRSEQNGHAGHAGQGAGRLGVQRIVELLPPAMFAALIVLQTFNRTDDLRTTLTRLLGVAVGAVAAWRRTPLLVVIVLAAATTAGARALT